MIWSADCSGLPHSHAALSANPHFCIDALKRPSPVRKRFIVVRCGEDCLLQWHNLLVPECSDVCGRAWLIPTLASTPLPIMHLWTCPQRTFELSVSCAAWLYRWRDLSLRGGAYVVDVV